MSFISPFAFNFLHVVSAKKGAGDQRGASNIVCTLANYFMIALHTLHCSFFNRLSDGLIDDKTTHNLDG